ncbi:MAG: precorrin-2 C(20)-methyltransferase [Alphaproteobacteria bacterium]|nr:precorrin-2 C(20)-methyltransferase [Alphaproteobacteria bacterium]
MNGTLYGLGVGPGDPDLITLKAYGVLQRVPVIAYPAPDEGDSLARAIAAPHLPGNQVEIVIRTPMVPGEFPAHDVYDKYAIEIAAHLDAGRDVAVLCEGDPFLYGSFMYIFTRLADAHRIQVIPGVSSIVACAAAAGAPLVSRNQVLTVVPATLDADDLERRIAGSAATAVMKLGRHISKVRDVLTRLGRVGDAWYVEHASMASERVLPLADFTDDHAPYFSMILVRQSDGETGC